MRYPAYPIYKKSSCNYVGDIPHHWQQRRLKEFGQLVAGSGFPLDEQGMLDEELPFFKVGDLGIAADNKTLVVAQHTISQITAEKLRASIVPSGAIVYAKIGAALLLNRRRITTTACCIDNNMTAFVPDKNYLNTRWAHYWLSRIDFGVFVNPGAIPSLSEGYQGEIAICIPPLVEQKIVADFLDWKTGQIDALIAKKQALIEKLKEKRLAVITQAVTKGLDASVPLRDSGISWLGKVPARWSVKRLRYCAGTVTSGSRGWAEFFSESGALFLRITNLDRESISLKLDDLQRVEPPDGAEGARTLTKAGDLLISITADLGSVAVIPQGFESAYISQHLSLVRLDSDEIDPNWIAYSILSLAGKYQLNTAGYGGTKIQLSLSDIKDITFCHPATLDEQQSILRVVRQEIERNNKLIELAEEAITRLTEYRTALITAATTGQIDVRKVAIPAQA